MPEGEIELRLTRMPLPAGWLELALDGRGESSEGPGWRLLLDCGADGATRIEVDVGRSSRILHVELPVARARLLAEPGKYATGQAALRPVGAFALLWRTWRLDARETLLALRWRLLGKNVRARNMLLRLLGLPRRTAHAAWLARQRADWAREVAALAARLDELSKFRITVVVACHPGESAAADTLASIAQQRLAASRVIATDDVASASVEVQSPRTGGTSESCTAPSSSGDEGGLPEADWIVVLRNQHTLVPDALIRIAAIAAAMPEPAAVTWDSDAIGTDGARQSPELKPEWNEALYLSRDYIGAFAVSRRAIEHGRKAGPQLPEELPDALLLAAARSGIGPIAHIQRVLSQRLPGAADRLAHDLEARRRLVEVYVRGEATAATASLAAHGMIRVQFPLPAPRPLVSVIVPTRDRLDLLEPCLAGVLGRTDYAEFEVLVADNGSSEPATRAYLDRVSRDNRIRVIDCAGPFNFAAINNRAVAEARGSVLAFLNNDVEPIAADWLTAMVAHAVRCRVGAVGARLLYPSGLVQHAGVILGVGGYAGHAHRFARPTDWGYLGRLQAEQNFAAVTAACLVVGKSKFDAVGGFDANTFPVAYNDVDLCLRLRAAGYETLWTPYAELLHKESASRARDYSPARKAAYDEECRRFTARWGALVADDPYYHPALSRRLENFSLE